MSVCFLPGWTPWAYGASFCCPIIPARRWTRAPDQEDAVWHGKPSFWWVLWWVGLRAEFLRKCSFLFPYWGSGVMISCTGAVFASSAWEVVCMHTARCISHQTTMEKKCSPLVLKISLVLRVIWYAQSRHTLNDLLASHKAKIDHRSSCVHIALNTYE